MELNKQTYLDNITFFEKWWKVPVNKEWFTILHSSDRKLETVLKNGVGMGSSERVEGFNSKTIFLITSVSTRVKECKVY